MTTTTMTRRRALVILYYLPNDLLPTILPKRRLGSRLFLLCFFSGLFCFPLEGLFLM